MASLQITELAPVQSLTLSVSAHHRRQTENYSIRKEKKMYKLNKDDEKGKNEEKVDSRS